mgnify:CR=1 FL=1
MSKSNKMTASAARRIQSIAAKNNGGQTPRGSFAARAQSVVSKSKK